MKVREMLASLGGAHRCLQYVLALKKPRQRSTGGSYRLEFQPEPKAFQDIDPGQLPTVSILEQGNWSSLPVTPIAAKG